MLFISPILKTSFNLVLKPQPGTFTYAGNVGGWNDIAGKVLVAKENHTRQREERIVIIWKLD